MKTRMEIVAAEEGAYRKAGRKEKGQILDRLVSLTGYNRSYASHLLSLFGKGGTFRSPGGGLLPLVAEAKRIRRQRPVQYGPEILEVLRLLWKMMDYPCGKRLAPALPWLVPKLESHGELSLSPPIREKLLAISAATIDRLLAFERKRLLLPRGRSCTRPGTLLKHQIPIRTFADWDEAGVGFMEMDLVSHDGGNASGDFAYTLTLTDVATGWTELHAVPNRARKWVLEALPVLMNRLPFPLRGLDSDNGSEFINYHLVQFCSDHGITFTRSRPENKNDNCHVEQKNWSVVRKMVGYARYDTPREVDLLNRLYEDLGLYVNFFLPSFKLLEKHRQGARVRKSYDVPQTPWARFLKLQEQQKGSACEALRESFSRLNPAELRRRLDATLSELGKTVAEKQKQGSPQKTPALV